LANDGLISLTAMAAQLSIEPATLRRYVREGLIRAYKLPGNKKRGRLRFDPTEVREDLRNVGAH
jgi:predicted site-specific integrase-resolvase